MGFYSIYKIIKDMIRTLFGKRILKIIIILFIIFIVVFFLNQYNVFAINSNELTTVTINNIDYSLDINYILSNYDYYFLLNRSYRDSSYYYTNYRLVLSNTPLTVDYTSSNTSISGGDLLFISVTSSSTLNSSYSYSDATYLWNNTVFDTSLGTHIYDNNRNIRQQIGSGLGGLTNVNFLLSNYELKDSNNNTVFQPNYSLYTAPSLSNSISDLESLNFNNFIINANSFTQDMINNPDEPLVMLFYNRSLSNSSNTDGLYPIKEKYFYKESIYFDTTNSTDNNYIFNYPIFKTGIFFNIGSTYEIRFAKRVYIEEYNTYGYEYFDTNYVFTISSNVTQDYINQLNQQTATSTDEDSQEQLNNSIQQQTQSIDNINNTITDSNVDNSSIQLPTDNTTDPTQSGVDNIFQTIYNSFTSGTAQDIVFPIPNTNKNITLPANYTYNSLNNNNASWVINIIQAFYWYIISRYIIVDIMQKIRKIKQGNLDNIENSNIKEDML